MDFLVKGAVAGSEKKEAPGQRPIFPPPPEGSIVGAEAFHFRVRNGYGWFHLALVTRGLLHVLVRMVPNASGE